MESFNIDRRAIHEQVYDYLKNAILNGVFKPGEKLNQDELAQNFGTSRMPIRDALRLLQADQLVDNTPSKGFTVAQFSEAELKDTMFLRRILEGEAIKLAEGRLTSEDIEKLEQLVAEMSQCLNNNDLTKMPSLNAEFHFTIYNAVPSPKLLKILGGLWDNFPRYAMLTTVESALISQKGHQEILEAIKSNNFELASELMVKHIGKTYYNISDSDLVNK